VVSDMCSRGVLHTVDSDDGLPRIRTPDPFIDFEGIWRDILGECGEMCMVKLWVVSTVQFCVELRT
jgi:hypothetical protein